MRHRLVVGAVIAFAAIAGLAYLFWPKPIAEPPVLPAKATGMAAPPPIEHPLPESLPDSAAAPLPALADSDTFLVDSLGELIGAQSAHDLVAVPGVARRLVATVDHLGRDKLPVLTRAVGPIPGSLAVVRDGERITLDEANFARYAPYVALVERLDVGKLAALYQRIYPLLQQAYGEVGPADRYFNDRVIAVIDELLATPQVAGPIELEQPSVHFRFKDPALEARSSGQKLLLRMGDANATVVKERLVTLRALIARQ
jgi:hypothetical protein